MGGNDAPAFGEAHPCLLLAPAARLALAGQTEPSVVAFRVMYLPSTGMPQGHYASFQAAAEELELIIVVRNTNPRSKMWIERGYPPKPMTIKCHTSKKTGKVTAVTAAEIAQCRTAGFYVIDSDCIARRGPNEALQGRFPFATSEMHEAGQVIDPVQRKALVGDYDLMGVIDPASTGSNLVLVTSNGVKLNNLISPDVERARAAVNRRLDQPRVMHGAQDQFGDFPEDGGAAAFFPKGLVWELKDEQSIRGFYDLLHRQPITGTYRNV